MTLIILQHYGSRTAEKEGFAGVIDNLWNICENLAKCAWSFAHHLSSGLIKVAETELYRVDLIGHGL